MDDMIERVARALAKADGKDPDAPAWWSPRQGAFGLCWREQYADKARAAVEAMREPTEAVHEAGWKARDPRANIGENATLTWQAMIDAALTPSPQ